MRAPAPSEARPRAPGSARHHGAPLDDVIVVDWSAAATPATGADSIWLAHAGHDTTSVVVENLATRRRAFERLGTLIGALRSQNRRVLVGLDFSFGYPSGFSELCADRAPDPHVPIPAGGPKGPTAGLPPWWRSATWLRSVVVEGPANANNRFDVACSINRDTRTRLFWGRPAAARYDHLRELPPRDVVPSGFSPNPLPRLRVTESHAGGAIKSAWQLYGRGSVGGQMLTGIPMLVRLIEHLGPALAVWPFETAFTPDPFTAGAASPGRRRRMTRPVPVVVAEVWPSLFAPGRRLVRGRSARPPDPVRAPTTPAGNPSRAPRSREPSPGGVQKSQMRVRDEIQVAETAQRLVAEGMSGLSGWFCPSTASELSSAELHSVLTEEGWILGVC